MIVNVNRRVIFIRISSPTSYQEEWSVPGTEWKIRARWTNHNETDHEFLEIDQVKEIYTAEKIEEIAKEKRIYFAHSEKLINEPIIERIRVYLGNFGKVVYPFDICEGLKKEFGDDYQKEFSNLDSLNACMHNYPSRVCRKSFIDIDESHLVVFYFDGPCNATAMNLISSRMRNKYIIAISSVNDPYIIYYADLFFHNFDEMKKYFAEMDFNILEGLG